MAGLDFSWDNGVKRFQSGAFEIGGNALYFRNDNKTESITASETFLTAGENQVFKRSSMEREPESKSTLLIAINVESRLIDLSVVPS